MGERSRHKTGETTRADALADGKSEFAWNTD
jgi:hypothetical protein